MKRNVVVHLALGSNLGDRAANLTHARALLSEFVSDIRCSSIYETPPWGVTDQPPFLNQVVTGTTSLAPLSLLNRLKAIERDMGRKKTARYGPRIIDLDILLYGERVINYRRLQVPHPRMHERAFVLVPLAELSPRLVIPGSSLMVEDALVMLDKSGITLISTATRKEGRDG